MTRKDIDNIISALCPNDEDYDKPIISPRYLKQELEQLALEQTPCVDAISREEALKVLGEAPCVWTDSEAELQAYEDWRTTRAMLEGLPSVNSQKPKTEPCEDCVSRQAVIECFFDSKRYYRRQLEVLKDIEKLPSVNSQEPKTGIWKKDIDNNRRWDRVRFYCSECGDWQTYGKPKFCPNCGSRMDGGTE